jgi:uncharacterized protein
MRRAEKAVTDPRRIEEILWTCATGRLATVGLDGYPMVKPLNFAFDGRSIYFHTAQEGEKIEHIRRESRVCFEADLPVAYVAAGSEPCQADYLFLSVIVKGRAALVAGEEEKRAALDLLMRKYQPEGGYGEYPPEKFRRVGVVRVDVEEITAKEHLRDGALRESALEALRGNAPLPLRLPRS